ncbi:MAG: DUF748 domain-containing protein [Prolixibacteraceae bacterium]
MEKTTKIRLKKRYIVFLLALSIVTVVLVMLPGMARDYLVQHGEELTGRKIDLEKLKINYLQFSVTARNFDMYEINKKDIFVHFDELHINLDPWRLFQKEYKFSEITIIKPSASLLYSGKEFNFSDFMTSSDTVEVVSGEEEPVRYVVENLTISEGYIRYEDKTVPSVSELKNFSLKIPAIAWDNNHSELGADFVLGESGKVMIGGNIDQAAGRYTVNLKAEDIDVEPFAGYFKSYVNAGSIKGLLSTDLTILGEMENPMNVKVFGEGGLKNFAITGADQELFMSAKSAWTKIDSLDISGWNFCFADIVVEEPVMTAVIESESTNIEKILAPYLADTLSTDSTEVHYSIRNLNLKGGSIAFSDLTLHRPFRFDISGLDLIMKDLRDDAANIPIEFSMALNQSGILKGKAQVDMINPMNFSLDGFIHDLDMVSLSPYSEFYLARPVTRGVFNYDISLVMTPASLENNNRISIDKLEIGKRKKEKPVYRVPVGLALYVLKDRNDHIGFELPVTGNPSSPKFKLRRIIWKTFEEFLLKTGTQPINFIGNKLGVDPESIKQVSFNYLQDSLETEQTNTLDKIVQIITKKPDLSFSFVQTTDPDEEKMLIAIRKAKQLYVAGSGKSQTDQVLVSALPVSDDDPGFLAFLGLAAGEADEKSELYRTSCLQKAGNDQVLNEFNQLLEKRQALLKNYFADKGLPADSIQFRTADLRNLPDDLKKPQFVVEVSLE